MNRKKLKARFEQEMELAIEAEQRGEPKVAFGHLERAHILGQRWLLRHWRTHFHMLRLARVANDNREIKGQIQRILAVPLGWLSGWVPKGNPGGANINPLKPMPLPADMVDDLADFSVRKDVWTRIAILAAFLATAYGVGFVVDVRAQNGEGIEVSNNASTDCRRIPGISGAEDIVIAPSGNLAIAIGGNRRSFRSGGPGRGRIWAFDPLNPTNSRELRFGNPASFRSFGADLLTDADGIQRLFVANRSDNGHGIEIFRVEGSAGDERLVHENTLKATGFINPNDVVALGPKSALVTLDKESPAGGLLEIWEGITRKPSGRVVRIDDKGMQVVARGLLSSNGIARSGDGQHLYVGELVGRSVAVFHIDAQRRWVLQRRILMPFAVDNLTLRDDGKLIVAGHPKLLTLATGYQKSEADHSPSEVALVDPVSGGQTTLMRDSGAFHSGSSVGVQNRLGALIVGTAFGPDIITCSLA
jgi:arylesterase / paraoxonase